MDKELESFKAISNTPKNTQKISNTPIDKIVLIEYETRNKNNIGLVNSSTCGRG